jgi:hypothetical protein
MLRHLAPSVAPTCCLDCSGLAGVCTNANCYCHKAAAAPPDLDALAIQLERSRAMGAGAFSFARLAFLAGIREAVAQERVS